MSKSKPQPVLASPKLKEDAPDPTRIVLGDHIVLKNEVEATVCGSGGLSKVIYSKGATLKVHSISSEGITVSELHSDYDSLTLCVIRHEDLAIFTIQKKRD